MVEHHPKRGKAVASLCHLGYLEIGRNHLLITRIFSSHFYLGMHHRSRSNWKKSSGCLSSPLWQVQNQTGDVHEKKTCQLFCFWKSLRDSLCTISSWKMMEGCKIAILPYPSLGLRKERQWRQVLLIRWWWRHLFKSQAQHLVWWMLGDPAIHNGCSVHIRLSHCE